MDRSDDLKGKTEDILANLDPIRHLENLDYPRRAGTDGEREAAAYIIRTLTLNGYQPTLQEFFYSKPKLRSKIIPPLVFLGWIVLSLVNIRYLEENMAISLVVVALPLALTLAIFNFGRLMQYFSNLL